MFKKELDQAMAGDNLGLLLRGLRREQIHRGMCVVIPGTVKPAKKFLASFYILTKDEGGRAKGFGSSYRPQLYARTSGIVWVRNFLIVDMTVTLTYTKELHKDHMVMPGDNVELVCELLHPIALDKGMRFTIRNLLFIVFLIIRRGWFDYRHSNRNTDFGIKKNKLSRVYEPQTSFDLHSKLGGVLY